MKKKKLQKTKLNIERTFGEIFNEYCSSYVLHGDSDFEHKQQYLNVAAIAWNISIQATHKRESSINKIISDYRTKNPNAPEWDVKALKNDIMNLVSHKDKYYPSLKKQVVSAVMKEVDGEIRVVVTSLPLQGLLKVPV